MKYSRELIEEVRFNSDIIQIVSQYVTLTPKGAYYFGRCPFHNEKTASFTVTPSKQIYYCYGCGATGNVITFIMQIENYDFIDAVKYLAEKANINIENTAFTYEANEKAKKRAVIIEIHKKSARFYYNALHEERGKPALGYLSERQISKKTQIKYGLGYSPSNTPNLYSFLKEEGYNDEDLLATGLVLKSKKNEGYYDRFFNRIMFPIFDVSGNVIAFGGRVIDNSNPKYLNSSETLVFDKGKILYGLNFARLSKERQIIVVEGYMDAISLYQEGILNVVATLGTAFTQFHARTLKKYADTVVLLYDLDEPGIKAVMRAIPILTGNGVVVKVAQTEGSKDPDDYIKKNGKAKFLQLINNAKSHIDFQVKIIKSKYNFDDVNDIVKFTNEVSKILIDVSNSIEMDVYINEISKISGVSRDAIMKEVEKSKFKTDTNIVNYRPVEREYSKSEESFSKGLIDAQKNLLRIVAKSESVYMKVKENIDSDDLTDSVFSELFDIIGYFHERKQPIYCAEALNYFEDVGSHEKIAEILESPKYRNENYSDSENANYSLDLKDTEKELTEQIKIIKKHKIEKIRKLVENNPENAILLNNLAEEQRNVNKLYITLTDG